MFYSVPIVQSPFCTEINAAADKHQDTSNAEYVGISYLYR